MSLTNIGPRNAMPTIEMIHVGPGVAEKWLAKNVGNRSLKQEKIAKYARAMSAGRWRMTGEAIKFDRFGNLIDGQHRLLAVISSGATIALLVIRGLESEARDVMDTGATRTPADVLGFHGIKGGKDIAAVANVLTCWERGLYRHAMATPDSKAKLTNDEIVELVQERPEVIDATRFAVKMRRFLPVPVGALAVAQLRFMESDTDAADEFFGRIAALSTGGKGDPLNTLIRRVEEYRTRREQIRPATALYFLFRAWNAFRAGEELQKLQLGSAERGWVKIPEPR